LGNVVTAKMFVLFKCPHPRTESDEPQSSPAAGLKLQTSVPGVRENTTNQTGHRISLRLAYPPVSLGFVGSLNLPLPEVFETAGTLEWIVALPDGFEAQVISSGLEPQKTAPDLAAFGDYGRVLRNRHHTYLAKTLAPPAPISLNLKYRQIVPGLTDISKADSTVVLAH